MPLIDIQTAYNKALTQTDPELFNDRIVEILERIELCDERSLAYATGTDAAVIQAGDVKLDPSIQIGMLGNLRKDLLASLRSLLGLSGLGTGVGNGAHTFRATRIYRG